MIATSAPIALLIQGERLIHIEHNESENQHTLNIHDDQHTLELQGSFADAICAIIQQQPHPLLNHIEKNNPWLKGLSTARLITMPDHTLLLGTGLGMLFIELTSRCNERCIHCYADSSPERNEFLSLKHTKKILTQAAELGHPWIQFTGGDPLIHPDLVAITAYAQQLGLQDIEIYTNGLLLHPELLAQLTPFSPRFCFSLYSHDPSIHDAITRVDGSLQRTLAAIRRAQKQGLQVRIGIALMQYNAESLPATLAFLHDQLDIPAHFIRIDPINNAGRGADTPHAKNIHIQQQTSPHTNEGINNTQQRLGKLCVSASGDVHPCIFSRDIVLGNIHQSSLKEIIHAPNSADKKNRTMDHWQVCKKRLSCYDCRIIAYHLSAHSQGA